MKNFKDFGFEVENADFTEEKISIADTVNKEIIVLGFKGNVKTVNGSRHLMRIEIDGSKKVVFTGSTRIINMLEHPDIKFPFKTTILSFKSGTKRGYMFS